MNQNTPKSDYLAPDISEMVRSGIAGNRTSLGGGKMPQSQMTRAVARHLLPSCIAVPPLLWWVLMFGLHRGWYELETSLILFVYSVTVVFGVIVCLNLRRLAKMDVERAVAEEQSKLAREAAETANRFKSAFFANISHEIRTPLTAINGFAELMLNPQRTEEQRTADARVIRRNGEHLLTLINDILDLSKIEAGKMSVERILCCPAQVVGDVCSMLRHRATEKGLKLEVSFEGPIPKMIRTDPTRLRQVLINLIANAVKFTREGAVRVSVAIKPSVRAQKPMLEIKIADSGIGIPAEQMASLFQPFVQGDSTISRQYGGSGLGLAISRHFATALGGDIAASSEAGKGSTFTVTVETGSLIEVEMQDRPAEAMDAQENFSGPRVKISGHVLVAEDGTDNQALIAEKLRETGLKIEIAPNGQVACEKAMFANMSGNPFDLILMDVQMPVMDGYTATLQLRGNGYPGPIIALTANAMERDRSKCLQAGCNDFVTKPIDMKKLLKAIGKYMKIEQVAVEPAKAQAAAANRAEQVRKFYDELADELAQIEQAIDRQDREQLKDVAQLLLGKAAAAGLKDLAPQAAKLLQSAESEKSWINLRESAAEFASESQAQASQRQAA